MGHNPVKLKKFLSALFLLINVFAFSQMISGVVISEESSRLPKTLIININTDEKVWSNDLGEFSIVAKVGDEIRVVRENYGRASINIVNDYFLTVKLSKIPIEIEEVQIENQKIAAAKKEELRKSIGLPKAPEKSREKPAEAVDDILKPLIGIPPVVKIQAIYDVLSGKSRRLRRLYKYEDLQEGLFWIKNNIDQDYFAEAGISPEKLNDFLLFSLQDEKVLMYMKAKNVGGITVSLDSQINPYLERISRPK